MSNLISYAQILNDRQKFRQSGTKGGSDFNLFDTPTTKYFKIFFYFTNGDNEGNQNILSSSGLLTPTWLMNVNESDLYKHNTAWSYLKLNCEDERADLLVDFVSLLSNINSESPWYFSEITGLDAALERKTTMEKDIKFEEQRQKITINCIPDSYDDRIGTLMDLYRAITWSWTTKRMILPSNLKKFDMGILIFSDPVIPFHHFGGTADNHNDNNVSFDKEYKQHPRTNDNYAEVGMSPLKSDVRRGSYKYIELHNCEFDYSSGKASGVGLNNKEGQIPTYTIDILFDDCYETRFNEFTMKQIGDFISYDWDTNFEPASYQNTINKTTTSNDQDVNQNQMLTDYYEVGALQQLLGTATNIVEGVVKRAVMGNLYTFSLTKLGDQAQSLLDGNVWSAARGVAEYVRDSKHRKKSTQADGAIGNINYEDSQLSRSTQYTGTVIGKQSVDEIKSAETQYNIPIQNNANTGNPPRTRYVNRALGNLFTSSTIANNI